MAHRTDYRATQPNRLARVNAEFQPLQPQQQPLVRQVSTSATATVTRIPAEWPACGPITADLLTAEHRNGVENILQRWREATGPTPGVISLSFKEPPSAGPGGLAIDIRLQGFLIWTP
ncbi:MAG: hypothetical protein R3F53_05740 [Gammaproteobacteria bacterium]